MPYLKSCSSLTFLTTKLHWIKLAFRATFRFRSRHFQTRSCTIQARTKLWLQSGLQLPRGASSALCFADIRSSPFMAAVLLYGEPTSTLRQPAEPPPLHPWLTLFHCYGIWLTARWGCGRRREEWSKCASPDGLHRSCGVFKRVFTALSNHSQKKRSLGM